MATVVEYGEPVKVRGMWWEMTASCDDGTTVKVGGWFTQEFASECRHGLEQCLRDHVDVAVRWMAGVR